VVDDPKDLPRVVRRRIEAQERGQHGNGGRVAVSIPGNGTLATSRTSEVGALLACAPRRGQSSGLPNASMWPSGRVNTPATARERRTKLCSSG
jgi:hypothetical protein